jgi:glutathione S-transferase
MALELISFPICPFVQRSVITLLQKGVGFDIKHIDLANKPDWFLAISPLGKVPVLRIDGDTVLFESAAINEYIDETTEPRMLPDDPVERARARAWIGFAGTLLSDVMTLTTAGEEREFAAAEATLFTHIQQLEDNVDPKPFYLGEQFSLVDSTIAPVFMRMEWVMARRPLRKLADMPRVAAWSKTLLELPSVRKSVREDWDDLLFDHLCNKGSILTRPIP